MKEKSCVFRHIVFTLAVITLSYSELMALGIEPATDCQKVSHKAGHGALEDGVIALYDGLMEGVGIIVLGSH